MRYIFIAFAAGIGYVARQFVQTFKQASDKCSPEIDRAGTKWRNDQHTACQWRHQLLR